MTHTYTSESIIVLNDREATRRRPGMYVGDPQQPQSLTHLLKIALTWATEQASQGDTVRLSLDPSGALSIEHNGPGLPLESRSTGSSPFPGLILLLEHLYTPGGSRLGLCLLNHLSQHLTLTAWRQGQTWRRSWRQGLPTGPLTPIWLPAHAQRPCGTRLVFQPDPEIFGDLAFTPSLIEPTLHTAALRRPDLRLLLETSPQTPPTCVHHPPGLSQWLQERSQNATALHGAPFLVEGAQVPTGARIALLWCKLKSLTHEPPQQVLSLDPWPFRKHDAKEILLTELARLFQELALHSGLMLPSDPALLGEDVSPGLGLALLLFPAPGHEPDAFKFTQEQRYHQLFRTTLQRALRGRLTDQPALLDRLLAQARLLASLRTRRRLLDTEP